MATASKAATTFTTPSDREFAMTREIDLRKGGEWHFVWRKSDGIEMAMRGMYREVAAPERLVSTESWGGDWPETLNTLVPLSRGITSFFRAGP